MKFCKMLNCSALKINIANPDQSASKREIICYPKNNNNNNNNNMFNCITLKSQCVQNSTHTV